jgi:hypothetical protein
VAEGPPEAVIGSADSLTGRYLAGELTIPVPKKRRRPSGYVEVEGALQHNLRDIDVKIPLGVFCAITGVSGSGKSTLVNEILFKAVANRLHRAKQRPGAHRRVRGLEEIDKIINIDQSPIGRTPRSNPATYIGLFDHIRDLYSRTQEARARGYKPGRFSFNVKGGRYEVCRRAAPPMRSVTTSLEEVWWPATSCGWRSPARSQTRRGRRGRGAAGRDVLGARGTGGARGRRGMGRPSTWRRPSRPRDSGLPDRSSRIDPPRTDAHQGSRLHRRYFDGVVLVDPGADQGTTAPG